MRRLACLLLSVSFLTLGSCGNDGGAGTPAPTPTPSPTPVLTPAEKIAALESAGTIPTLNRAAGMLPNDGNSNGVRDDIDIYIASRPFSNANKRALTQVARAVQSSLTVDLSNADAVNGVAMKVTQGINCVFSHATSESDPATNATLDIQNITTNTKERLVAYLRYNKAVDGSVSSIPAGDTCE